jgi:transposase
MRSSAITGQGDALHGAIRGLAVMVTHRRGERLPQWLAQARAIGLPGLSSFVTGVEHDLAAVTAGLTQPWNSGLMEGHVNRIKMLKRQCTAAPTSTYCANES